MKKTNLFLAITIMAIVAIAVAVVSCKKEKQEPTTNNTEQSVQSVENMDEYLISFKKKLLSAQKGEEAITLEQAERDLGNLLNFDFGDANYPTDEYRYDTIHLKLAVSNNQIDLSQLANTYSEAVNTILEIYQDIDLPEKSVYAVVCQFNENERKDDDTEDLEIVLITRGLNSISYSPHDTLDWRPKNYAGTCDGQFINVKGGPEAMVSWLSRVYDPIACENGARLYYTNIGVWETDGYKHYDSDNECFMIYTSFDPDQNGICIPHEEMEYYFSNILNLYYQDVLTNHRFIFIKIRWTDYIHCYIPIYNQVVYECFTWHVKITHGKPNCTDANPIIYE